MKAQRDWLVFLVLDGWNVLHRRYAVVLMLGGCTAVETERQHSRKPFAMGMEIVSLGGHQGIWQVLKEIGNYMRRFIGFTTKSIMVLIQEK